jgi:hypothetical protein
MRPLLLGNGNPPADHRSVMAGKTRPTGRCFILEGKLLPAGL